MTAPAVFLDRDGTIIEDTGYVRDPDDVRLLPGAAEAIRRFSAAGHLVVIVSNQSGIARGLFDEAALAAVHDRVEFLLGEEKAKLDGAYYCPFLEGPDATVEAYRRSSDLRKPSPGMLLQAADELGIDLNRSWMIGDASRDVEAGAVAGCRTVQLRRPGDTLRDNEVAANHTVDSLLAAVEIVERGMTQDSGKPVRSDPPSKVDGVEQLLGKIHDQIARAQRPSQQHDFSLVRLLGSLLQMCALVAGVWGMFSLFDDQFASATAKFALACFLQIASLSAFLGDR